MMNFFYETLRFDRINANTCYESLYIENNHLWKLGKPSPLWYTLLLIEFIETLCKPWNFLI